LRGLRSNLLTIKYNLFTRLQYYYHRPLRRSVHRSVRLSSCFENSSILHVILMQKNYIPPLRGSDTSFVFISPDFIRGYPHSAPPGLDNTNPSYFIISIRTFLQSGSRNPPSEGREASLLQPQYHRRSNNHIQQSQWYQFLPTQVHQLVIPETGNRPPDP